MGGGLSHVIKRHWCFEVGLAKIQKSENPQLITIDSAWKWPDIEGLHTFQGDLFHTGNYKEGYDLTGKRVAVIGSGSSGVQVCASIYPDVEKLYTWVRSPTWITAAFGQQFAGKNGQNFDCKALFLDLAQTLCCD